MAITDDDAKIRQSWQEGHKVSIFSNSRKKWFDGHVAQIFHDDEGEWLEIRYDKSMSKQVQRYSTDIKPTAQQRAEFLRKKQQAEKKKKQDVPFPEQEMDLRKSWTKNDEVEIFSNTHQEWYRGEIVEIIKDEEGEWLNVVWARNNGEAMSKQVQRFSTDVRPAQDSPEPPPSPPSPTQRYIDEVNKRRHGFQRKCPLFSRTIQASNFTNPASGSVRNKKNRVQDIEEKDEQENQHRKVIVEDWDESKVMQFIAGLGKIYVQYKPKFRGIKGLDLLQLDDKRLSQMGLKKLHRLKLLIELAKLTDAEHSYLFDDIETTNVLNWDSKRVRKWAAKMPNISHYANNLSRHGVDGMILFELDEDDLDTLGVRPVHRKKFFDTIEEFHRISFPNAPPLARLRSNSQLDEKDEESVASSMSSKTSKRRQSVVKIDGQLRTSDFEKDELLLEMANLLLKLGNAMSGMPSIKDSVESLESKLNAFKTSIKSPSYSMTSANSSLNSFDTNENYDISVDTNLEDINEIEENDINGNSNINEQKLTKMKNRTMERLDNVESPAGMEYARPFMNTMEQKKGHRRRQSLPMINNNQVSMEEDNPNSDEDENEDQISDIE